MNPDGLNGIDKWELNGIVKCMSTAHTLIRDGANWELYEGAPYADHVVARFTSAKARTALAIATDIAGANGEWRQMTPSEYRQVIS